MTNCASHAVSTPIGGIHRKARLRILGALLAGSAITFPSAAAAQSITWDGEAGIDWATAANWSGNTLPGSADSVTINVAPNAVQPSVLTPQTVAFTDIVRGTLTVSSTLTSATVRLPNFLGTIRDPDLDNLQGHLVVTAGGSIVGTVTIGGFELNGVATRLEGPVSLSPASGIAVTSGGIAEFSRLSLGNGGVDRAGFVTVSGAGSRLTASAFDADGSAHTILVSAGGNLSTNQAGLAGGSATVTGAGSIWDIAATSNNNTNFGLFRPVTLNVLDGGRINSLNPNNMQLGGSANVRIAGTGSAIELAASISIGGNNGTDPLGSFVIEDGGSLIVHGVNDSGFGFSQRGEVVIRSGGSWILDGGLNAGLQIRSADLRIDGGTFSAGGIVSHSGNILSLRNANFTARELDASNLVQIGGGAAEAAAAAGVFNVGTVLLRGDSQLVLNHTEQNYVIGSSFQGLPGARISHIAGDTIFTGPFGGYAGDFSITGGSVRFNGSFGSNGARATVDNAGGLATVGGSGSFGGSLSVLNGTLAPGDGAGALGIGLDLVLGPNALLAFELGAPGGTPGVGSDLVNVGGNLTLDGTMNITDVGGFGPGLYRLINYSGTLTDNGLDIGSLPSGIIRSDVQLQTSVANQVNLVTAVPAPTSFPFWDGSNTSGDGAIAGGSGVWNATGTNWTTTDAATNGAYNPADFLIFTGPTSIVEEQRAVSATFAAPKITAAVPSATAGTVTVDTSAGDVTLTNGMQFAVDGYTVTGDPLVLAATVPCGECAPLPGKVIVRVGDGTEAGAGFVATIESALTGAAGLTKTDLGTLILSGTNSYSGGTEVTNGLLQGDARSLQGAIAVGTDGALLFAQTDDGTYTGALSGDGLFAKQGAGRLTLSGASSSFAGTSSITGGELAVDGTLGLSSHVLQLSGGATLSGGGQIGGSVFVEDGTISPGGGSSEQPAGRLAAAAGGDTVGLLTIGGDLSLTASSILAFQLGDPAGASGADSDLINVGSNLVLDGTVNVRDAGGFGAGLYRLINYDGTLTDNGLTIGAVPAGFTADDLTVQTSISDQVNLLVGAPVTSFMFWDGANTAANGVVNGGTATWRADTSNWTISSGSRNGVVDPGQLLIFAGSAGTVTVDNAGGPVRATAGMQFATDGYRIEGGDITLDGPIATVRVGDGTALGKDITATIASALTGTARLDKTDLGTLILAGANAYSGGTTVTSGTLQGDASSLQGAINIGTDGTLRFAQGNDGSYTNSLSGSGLFAKQNGGTLTLSGDSSGFAGTSSVTGGELAVDGSLGSTAHSLKLGGGATLSGGGQIGGSVVVEDGVISPGGTTQLPPEELAAPLGSKLAASANAASAGGQAVGLLTIGGDLSLSAPSILAFQLGDPAGEAGVTSDLLNVGGSLTLDGTLNISDAGGFGPGLYRLINYGGTLVDNGLGIGAVPDGIMPEDLAVQTSVANQVNLVVGAPITSFMFWDGANTASNGVVNGGTATWRADTTNWTLASGSRNGVVDPSQLLIFAGSAGKVTVDNAGGPVRATAGMQFATNGYRIEGGPIALDGSVATVRLGDGTAPGKDITATIASALTGTARLDKTDLGTLVLSGANTYTGGTRVLGGVLQIADDGALGASSGALTLDGGTVRSTADLTTARGLAIGSGGGTLDSGGNALTLSGTISGTGRLNLSGTGLRTLTGNSAGYAGTTTLAAGMLALPGSLGGNLIVAAPARLTGTGRVGSLDLSGTISPGASTGQIGTFNVTGDLTIRAGSKLLVDLAAGGAGDRIEVGGRAVLEGGTVVVTALDPERNYADGTVYRIVNAAGGRSGTLAGLSETSAFLDFGLGYDATGVFLTTDVIAQFPDVAQTTNQIAASETLSALDPGAGTDSLAVYNQILMLGAEPARAAFDAASGEIYPTLLAGRQRAGMALIGRITNRSRALGREGLSIWGGAPADRWHVDRDGNAARSTADNFGLESGLDYRGPDNAWALGFGGGWQDGRVNLQARASRATLDAWHIGGYARFGSGGAGFTAVSSVVYASADAAVTRQISFGTLARTATSSVDLSTLAARGDVRFGFGNDRFAIGPVASIDLTSTKLGRFAETGADALDLSGKDKRESWTRYGIGGFARIGIGRGFADLAVRYEHRDRGDTSVNLTMAGSPTGFAVRTAGGSRSALRVDASTEFAIGDRWAISANVGGTHADKEGQLDGSVRLSYRF